MKILWLSHLLPYPPKAGVIQRSYHLLKQLSSQYDVDVLAFNQIDLLRPMVPSIEQGIEDGLKELNSFCNVKGLYNVPCDSSPFGKPILAMKSFFDPNGYTLNWLKFRDFEEKLTQLLQKENYDLIHMDTISFAPYMNHFKHIPTILDHHNIESHMMHRRAENERTILKRIYYKIEAIKLEKLEKNICQAIEHNITCSDTDTARLLKVAPTANVSTIPNGVDTGYYTPTNNGPRTRLTFIGTMNWYPNIEAVMFIFDELAKNIYESFPNLTIDIVGSSAPDFLVDASKNYKNVTLHGFVDDIRPIMNETVAILCPIKDGGGTKLKILDAMSMSLPIIAHPIACEGISLEDEVSVLLAENTTQYLNAIKRLTTSNFSGQEVGSNARKIAKELYSVDTVGKTLRDLYYSVYNSSQ